LSPGGGLARAERRNIAKAALYDFLDSGDFYANPVAKRDRSRMDAPFILADPELDTEFLAGAAERGLVELKGHRSVGGMRLALQRDAPGRCAGFGGVPGWFRGPEGLKSI
jgi:phosphoserine aminotransferase